MLTTLAAIAASLGLSLAVDEINRIMVDGQKLSPDQIATKVNNILDQIRAKSNKKYNDALDALQNAPSSEFYAGALKEKVREIRQRLYKEANRQRDIVSDVENKLSSIQQRSANLQMSSDAYRLHRGKDDVNSIISDLNKVDQTLDDRKTDKNNFNNNKGKE